MGGSFAVSHQRSKFSPSFVRALWELSPRHNESAFRPVKPFTWGQSRRNGGSWCAMHGDLRQGRHDDNDENRVFIPVIGPAKSRSKSA